MRVKAGTPLGARLKAAIELHYDGDVDELHYASRVSTQVIYAIINGTTPNPTFETLDKLVRTNLGSDWVFDLDSDAMDPSEPSTPEYASQAA